jgi:hypothetical protein
MQTASVNFATAISASSGVWAPHQVHADWASNGYDGDNTIDDLTPLAGKPIVIKQALDDGMPSGVTFTAGRDSTSAVTLPVGGRTVSGVVFNGPQYWSVDNSSSPLSGYDRDIAPLTVAAGIVTAGGTERVTVFTGQMWDAPIKGRTVQVNGVSRNRTKLSRLVQPPPIIGDSQGLTATWPISWALAQCGIYASPPPRAGCRGWIPMHGSLVPFLDSTAAATPYLAGLAATFTITGQAGNSVRPTFVTGPYVLGVFAEVVTNSNSPITVEDVPLAAGTDFLSQAASAGRVEWWTRGDVDDSAHTPNGAPASLVRFFFQTDANTASAAGVTGGIGTDRKVFITAVDGAGHAVTLKSASALASDGAWYFCGLAWDIAGKKLWVNLNGTVGTSAVSTFVTSSLPATDSLDAPDGSPGLSSYLPIAEVQFTSGATANPDNFVWLNDPSYFTASAVIRPSLLNLVALGEPKPREAWEFINTYAQSELAMVRTDELDRVWYLPMTWLAESTQLTSVDTLSTALNAGTDLTPTRDLTKIRNQVTVNYQHTLVNDFNRLPAVLFLSFTVWIVPPGTTTQTIVFGPPTPTGTFTDLQTPSGNPTPALAVSTSLTLLTSAQAAAGGLSTSSYVTLNAVIDGSGTYATSAQVTATVTAWNAGKATLTFVNLSSTTYYTVNNGSASYVQIVGSSMAIRASSVTVQDTASIAIRDVRGLSADTPGVHDLATATFIANEILGRSRVARPQVTVTVRGDPRRQPGDLVTLADPNVTNIGGQWRSLAVDTTLNGAEVTQAITAVKTIPVAVWDQTNWDQSIWGP